MTTVASGGPGEILAATSRTIASVPWRWWLLPAVIAVVLLVAPPLIWARLEGPSFNMWPMVPYGLLKLLLKPISFLAFNGLFEVAAASVLLALMTGRRVDAGQALRRGFRALPTLSPYIFAETPLVAAIAWWVLSHTDGFANSASEAAIARVTLILSMGISLVRLGKVFFFGVLVQTVVEEDVHGLVAYLRAARRLKPQRWLLVGLALVWMVVCGAPDIIERVWLKLEAPTRINVWLLAGGNLLWAVFAAAFYLQLLNLRAAVAPGEVAGVFD